ncbi:hypothetical protein ATANTOWER_014764 [Ataeniobius toweri]|uniref:Uncharacterized protein n=1 Tax=Ataeniobius toweri TaxID=208326 RepID=A0ABU7BKB1_9TELE|nr:hypothetical protein [Ataeniobius toweri]
MSGNGQEADKTDKHAPTPKRYFEITQPNTHGRMPEYPDRTHIHSKNIQRSVAFQGFSLPIALALNYLKLNANLNCCSNWIQVLRQCFTKLTYLFTTQPE